MKVDPNLKKEIEWMNENLKSIVANQDIIFGKLLELEKKIDKEK